MSKNEIGMSSFLSLLGKHLNGDKVDCKSLVEALQEKEALENGPLSDSVIEEHRDPNGPFEIGDLVETSGFPEGFLINRSSVNIGLVINKDINLLEFNDPTLGRLRVLQEGEPLEMCEQKAYFWGDVGYFEETTITNPKDKTTHNGITYYMPVKEYRQWKKEEQKPWEPKSGRYYIDYEGDIASSYSNKNQRLFGNEFQTKGAAEHTAPFFRFYHRLCQLAIELNPSGRVGGEWCVELGAGDTFIYNRAYGVDAVFENEEAAQKAADIMNRDCWELPV